MKAGIVIEAWKLPIFERHLTQSGYKFTKVYAFKDDAFVLTVVTENASALHEVIKAAQDECDKTGAPKP